MRLILTLLFVVFCSINSIGQSISISEMEKMSKMDADNFDSFIISKGYEFTARTKESNYTILTYDFSHNIDENRTRTITVGVGVPVLKNLSVSYETYDKDEYLKLKEEIIKLGYKSFDLESLHDHDGKGGVSFHYIKGKRVIKVLNQTRFFTFNVSELK